MKVKMLIGFLCVGLLASCAVRDVPDDQLSFNAQQRWVMLPVLNYSSEPRAGERTEAILGTLLQMKGVNRLTVYPNVVSSDGLPELNERKRLNQALGWAKSQGFKYGFTGTINEWRYKSGLDAEPAVGFTLQLMNIKTGTVIWSSSGARSGWGRESLSGNAQKVLGKLVDAIPFQDVEG